MNLQKSIWIVGSLMSLGFISAAASPAAPGAAISRYSGSAYNNDAISLETTVRRELNAAMSFTAHRRQAFRGEVTGTVWHVLSAVWQLDSGGEAHCILAAYGGSHWVGDYLVSVDALTGETDAPPWSCDGEPALKIVDLNGDGCPEVLALYPMRPPSGERFYWPLVLRCAAAPLRWDFDRARSQRLRAGLTSAPLPSLKQAEALLKSAP
jgi:hypothetical protein